MIPGNEKNYHNGGEVVFPVKMFSVLLIEIQRLRAVIHIKAKSQIKSKPHLQLHISLHMRSFVILQLDTLKKKKELFTPCPLTGRERYDSSPNIEQRKIWFSYTVDIIHHAVLSHSHGEKNKSMRN